ncbi:MAG: hypothetical protein F7C37_04325 [Desulfurococcales archaeon]|nr:hypothetical protein [Desulfurococcales archaeon]
MTSIEHEILSCCSLLPLYLGEGRRRLIRIISEELRNIYGYDLVVNSLDAIIVDMREFIGDYAVASYIYTFINGDVVVWSSKDMSLEGLVLPDNIVVLPKSYFEDMVKSLKELSNGVISKPKLLLSSKIKCLKREPLECYISSYKEFVYRYDDISLQLKCNSSTLRIDTVMLADKFVSSLIEGTGKLVDSIASHLPWHSRRFFAKKVKDEITDEALKYLARLAKKYMIIFPKTPEYMELFKIS